MTIAEARTSCKTALRRAKASIRARISIIPKDALVVLALLLASSASFGLGILAGQGMAQQGDISTSQIPETDTDLGASTPAAPTNLPASILAGGQVVASKNGTKYYVPTCSGAARIAAANKVYFANAQAAEAAGYTPAANCKAP